MDDDRPQATHPFMVVINRISGGRRFVDVFDVNCASKRAQRPQRVVSVGHLESTLERRSQATHRRCILSAITRCRLLVGCVGKCGAKGAPKDHECQSWTPSLTADEDMRMTTTTVSRDGGRLGDD